MNKFNLIKISLILASIIYFVSCEKFSAISEMEKLAYNEEVIIKEFTNFVGIMEDEVRYLKRKLDLWQQEYSKVQEDIVGYITNPINAYLMIKRTSINLKFTEQRIEKLSKKFMENIKEIQPNEEDLQGAVGGLLRLQNIYKLKTSNIVNGIIAGHSTNSKLTDHDIYTIIESVLRRGRNERILETYIQELKASNKNTDEVEKVSENQILEIESIFKATNPDPYVADTFVKNGIYSKEKEAILYSRICRGEGLKSPRESALLKCRYIYNSLYSLIAPFKIEEADHSSGLVLFHDVVYDSEIEILKNISKSKFTRGLIYENKKHESKTDQRVAKVAWFSDGEGDKVVERISKRVEDMTGLTTKTADQLQIQNYGIGGHYQPHYDMRLKGEEPFTLGTGNRIATVLFYLSTVEKGGATVFPYLKVYVPAVKGMAAFWYNLKDNGDGDYYTRHAACPVLLGSKWVANKWIHEYGQEFRRPCKTQYQNGDENELTYIREFY